MNFTESYLRSLRSLLERVIDACPGAIEVVVRGRNITGCDARGCPTFELVLDATPFEFAQSPAARKQWEREHHAGLCFFSWYEGPLLGFPANPAFDP